MNCRVHANQCWILDARRPICDLVVDGRRVARELVDIEGRLGVRIDRSQPVSMTVSIKLFEHNPVPADGQHTPDGFRWRSLRTFMLSVHWE